MKWGLRDQSRIEEDFEESPSKEEEEDNYEKEEQPKIKMGIKNQLFKKVTAMNSSPLNNAK
jgi:hypothetical protein